MPNRHHFILLITVAAVYPISFKYKLQSVYYKFPVNSHQTLTLCKGTLAFLFFFALYEIIPSIVEKIFFVNIFFKNTTKTMPFLHCNRFVLSMKGGSIHSFYSLIPSIVSYCDEMMYQSLLLFIGDLHLFHLMAYIFLMSF